MRIITTTICLVRHGETDWNVAGKLQGQTDIPLNGTGRGQAEACARYLQQFPWDVVVTSPLKRAKQTAEIIRQKVHVPLIEMEAFVERGFGEAEGMTVEEKNRAFPDGKIPGLEGRDALVRRLMNGLEELRRTWEGKRILLVSHGGAINALLAVLSDGEIGSGKTRIDNASLNTIEFQDTGWVVVDYNQTAHLSGA